MHEMSAPNSLISVQEMSVEFATSTRGQTVKAVNQVSFEVSAGETFGVIGESGSGKSTLGRTLVALQSPTRGKILHDGVDMQSLSSGQLRTHRRNFQIIFQDPNAALNPRMRVIDAVMEPLRIAGELSAAHCRALALQSLSRVGLPEEYASRYPHQFSGGQKQRIIIARALTLQPKVLVCDEVVAALDVSIRGDVLNLFADLQREFGLTYVFITHDISVVSHISDRIAVMYLGALMELGPAEAVTARPLHPYTRALLAAEPRALPSYLRQAKREVLKGEIPSPIHPPSGCVFRTRCPQATALCAEQRPTWQALHNGHWVACHYAGSSS